MKRTFLVIILVGSLLLLCGCLSKEEIARRKAYDEDVYKARTIRYRCSYTEVWNALYSMIAEHFPIARESESRGYIESDWKIVENYNYRNRTKIKAEILGDSLFRVVIRCPCQREKGEKVKGKYEYKYTGDWKDIEDDKKMADKFYYWLYDRLKVYGIE